MAFVLTNDSKSSSPSRLSLKRRSRPSSSHDQEVSEPAIKRPATPQLTVLDKGTVPTPTSSSQVLHSPTHRSTFHVNTKSPFQRASVVHKISRANLRSGTETTLYTISVTRSLKDNTTQRAPMDDLMEAALSELKKPGMQSPRAALQSVENLTTTNTHFRVKTVPSKTSVPLPGATPQTTGPNTSVKRFSYVFK